VWISECGALESLNGLAFDDSEHSIYLERVPALANIDALADILTFDTLIIDSTGLEALPAFAPFSATEVYVTGNPALLDASGLAAIGSVRTLQVGGNASLRSLPALTQLEAIDSFSVTYNDALEEMSLDFPALQPQVFLYATGPREYPLSAELVEVGDNASLRRITSSVGFSAIQNVSIYSNPSLTELELGTLARADLLAINDNAVLASVAAPALATVDSLEVTNNPLLVPTVFDDVQTFRRQVSGDAEAAAQP
jgi:hypothetical protein